MNIQRLTENWKELDGEISDDNGNVYNLSNFMPVHTIVVLKGKTITVNAAMATSAFGGIGLELDGDMYRMYNMWE